MLFILIVLYYYCIIHAILKKDSNIRNFSDDLLKLKRKNQKNFYIQKPPKLKKRSLYL